MGLLTIHAGADQARLFRDPVDRKDSLGFTLAEILVALAIMSVLMSGLVLLFVGNLRTVSQTNQASDAYERARGALNAIKEDILNTNNPNANGYIEGFYGTPIGMTFITNVKLSDDPKKKDFNLARVTYVVYNLYWDLTRDIYGSGKTNPCTGDSYGDEDRLTTTFFEQAVYSNGPTFDGYTYAILRYVESGVSNLDQFPINWDAPLPDPYNRPPAVILLALCNQLLVGNPNYPGLQVNDLDKAPEEVLKTARREFWIRTMAGGDSEVPNAWDASLHVLNTANCPVPAHYALTENVLSSVSPQDRFNIPGNWWGSVTYLQQGILVIDPVIKKIVPSNTSQCEVRPYFNYGNIGNTGAVSAGDSTLSRTGNLWWSDNRCTDLDGQPNNDTRDTRLPQVVDVNLWLMFEKTYPSAPDFKREFSVKLYVPTGYQRAAYPYS